MAYFKSTLEVLKAKAGEVIEKDTKLGAMQLEDTPTHPDVTSELVMKKMETLELEITELRMENEQLKVENNS
jgi:hypothetical protein